MTNDEHYQIAKQQAFDLLQNKTKDKKSNYRAICPFCNSPKRNFFYDLESGQFNCFRKNNCGVTGNAYTILKYLNIGVKPDTEIKPIQVKQEPKKRELAKRTPDYIYTDEKSNPKYGVGRFVDQHGKKQTPSYHYYENRWYRGVVDWYKDPKYIYNLPEVIKSDYVIFCEGEKKTAYLQPLLQVNWSATCFGGSTQRIDEHNLDYLKNKTIFIFADNDMAGRKFAKNLYYDIVDVALGVKIFIPGDHYCLGPESDIFDFIKFLFRDKDYNPNKPKKDFYTQEEIEAFQDCLNFYLFYHK